MKTTSVMPSAARDIAERVSDLRAELESGPAAIIATLEVASQLLALKPSVERPKIAKDYYIGGLIDCAMLAASRIDQVCETILSPLGSGGRAGDDE